MSAYLCAVPALAQTASSARPKAATKVKLAVVCQPTNGGSVSGGGDFFPGTLVTLKAMPAPHFVFTGWIGQVNNPTATDTKTYVSSSSGSIIAKFEPEQLMISVKTVPAGAGQVDGGGLHAYGSLPVLRVIPKDGYFFAGWTGPVAKKKDVETPIAAPLSAAIEVTAHFERITKSYTLSVGSTNPYAGKVSGGGVYPDSKAVTIKADPSPGYLFNGWKGPVMEPGKAETIVYVKGDTKVEANFEPKRVLVNTIISPTGAGQVTGDIGSRPIGVPCTLRAEAAPGYVFVNWDGIVSDPKKATTTLTPSEGKTYTVTARFRALN